MAKELHELLSELVEQYTGSPFRPTQVEACHGGCIHHSGIHSDGERRFFVKMNGPDALAMFEAEANGLRAMGEAGAIRVPKVVGHGVAGGQSILVLEALDLGCSAGKSGWQKMGEQLAQLHRSLGESHGWDGDNFIGASPQPNRRRSSWTEFFVEERLRFQFELAEGKGMNFDGWEAFLEVAASRLKGHQAEPSLLHGDLWSGNAGFTSAGEPVIYDPACYHGDRECDLAFSEFFGGFPESFYKAYRQAWPLDPGYEERRDLYNLYHVLNHANLFGAGYAGQAQSMMRSLGDL